MGFPQTTRRSTVYNWSYDTFLVFHKTNSLMFGLEPPCADRGQIEPTSVFRVITDSCQISSRSVDMWGIGGRKTSFRVITEHNHASAWSLPSIPECNRQTDGFLNAITHSAYSWRGIKKVCPDVCTIPCLRKMSAT